MPRESARRSGIIELPYCMGCCGHAHVNPRVKVVHRRYKGGSWETARSTSGWVVLWQSAALSWGSRQQKGIALSSCEAEIIALSEAAKDVIYLRI